MKPIEDPMQNFADFIESIGFSEGWAPDGLQSVDQFILPFDPVAALQTEFRNDTTTTDDVEDHSSHGHVPEENFLSNFGSRLPSLQPESGEQEDRSQRSGGAIGIQLTRNIREADYRSFLKGLNYFQCVLPGDFSAPSKFKLSRFFHGFIDGLNEHLPFIHTPTLRIGSCNPALVLAIAACGAQYRFEGEEGLTLFCAAQAIILEILRQRSYGTSPNLLSSSLLSTCRGVAGFWSHSPDRSEQESAELMEAMQAILLLVIHATWGGDARAAQESMTLQGNLASLVRVHGLGEKPAFEITDRTNDVDWCRWAKEESNRRTKFVVFCFLNLHSLMHNTPPLILNSDLGLNMPCSAEVWTAQNASAWGLVYEKAQNRKHSCFQESISLLFKAKESSAGGEMACTAFGNHILLHALSQQLFFARQLCRLPLEQGTHRHHITGMDAVLRTWKSYWKQTPESSTDPRNPSGPIAFTSAALLGQIYVRLQIDLGPHRALMTRDPSAIAQALAGAPNDVVRGPGFITALLHAVHALSIPIQLGIGFVARTYSFHWSVQHCLSALEYAHLLTTWLRSLPNIGLERLPSHERKLYLWITRLLDETDLGIKLPIENRLELIKDPKNMRQLSCSIIRVWTRSFSGNLCWGIVDVVSASLRAYADLLEEN